MKYSYRIWILDENGNLCEAFYLSEKISVIQRFWHWDNFFMDHNFGLDLMLSINLCQNAFINKSP